MKQWRKPNNITMTVYFKINAFASHKLIYVMIFRNGCCVSWQMGTKLHGVNPRIFTTITTSNPIQIYNINYCFKRYDDMFTNYVTSKLQRHRCPLSVQLLKMSCRSLMSCKIFINMYYVLCTACSKFTGQMLISLSYQIKSNIC
jgi:hypothetical protein